MHLSDEFLPGKTPSTGRVALVTGGAVGIGAAVVRGLAGRGFAVAIHCHASLREARDLAASLVAAGLPSLALTADLRDEGATRTMVHRVTDHFGRIDALVTCAGIDRPAPLEETTADDLQNHFLVSCMGAFVTAQEAGATMVRQESGGGIVMLAASTAGPPRPGHVGAITAAAALPGLVGALAAEFAARNPRVRVNGLLTSAAHPGDAIVAADIAEAVAFLIGNGSVNAVCLPVGVAVG